MRGIAAIEVSLSVRELQALEGFYVDNFYELGENRFRFRLSRGGEKTDLFCLLPLTLNITEYVEKGEPGSNFYLAVRKRIAGARIESISQLNEDRIVEIDVARGGERERIVMELFAKGNLLILDHDGKIQLAYRSNAFRDREVKVGRLYLPPKSRGIPVSHLEREQVLKLINGGKDPGKSLIKALSESINLGAAYLENAIIASGLKPKATIGSIDAQGAERLAGQIQECRSYLEAPEIILYTKDGKPIDYSICRLEKYKQYDLKSTGTLNSALDIFYHESQDQQVKSGEGNRKIESIRISIEKQKGLLEEIDMEASAARSKGEEIFKNMGIIGDIIEAVRENRHMTKEELQKRFPGARIIDVDLKEKTVTIDI